MFLEAFLARLERLAACIFIRRDYATPRQQRYLELLRQLDDGAGLQAPAFELADREKSEMRELLAGDIYIRTRVARYVLLRLDSILAADPGATYDHKILTVEHVLPQTPAAQSKWLEDFTPEQVEQWTHRLGNLLLLNRRVNSYARNYDFDVKKNRYFMSSKGVAVFALTTQVLAEPVWTPEVVQRRQEQLLGLLFEVWQV